VPGFFRSVFFRAGIGHDNPLLGYGFMHATGEPRNCHGREMSEEGTNSDQLGFDLGDVPERASEWPNPEEVREDALAMLASARAVTAEALWDRRTYRYNKVVFPQMTRWLPDDEREQLCFEFFKELERIELLMAA
jgi:hypothetical protein